MPCEITTNSISGHGSLIGSMTTIENSLEILPKYASQMHKQIHRAVVIVYENIQFESFC